MTHDEDGEFVTTTKEILHNFGIGVNAGLDIVTSDKTIKDEETRAALIRKFEELDELLDEARKILGQESSEDE
jgi:hypothetical protein